MTKLNNATAVPPAFHFAGTSVSPSNSIQVLGFTVDLHLTFDSNVTKIVIVQLPYAYKPHSLADQ